MARIAYIDHSFHQTTKSTEFLPALLRRNGHVVDQFWDAAWKGDAPVAWKSVAGYDVVIMFQSFCPPDGSHYRLVHPNVIYIPMLDQFGMWLGPMFNLSPFWEVFQGSKVLNFSNALHCLTTGAGIASQFVRYYQPVLPSPPEPKQGLHGFFWLRRELQLPWKTVRTLIEKTHFDSFHLHLAVDPGTPPAELPSAEDIARFNITTSTWFQHKSDLNAVMSRANVYFAPRPGEGIGQSFLEAMSCGQCVIAPNQGTMNEYIVPGINGLLYDHERPHPLNFSRATDMGRNAYEGAVAGRAIWEAAEQDIVNFVLRPSADFYLGKYQHQFAGDTAELVAAHLPTGLRALAQQNSILRSTRKLWHPLVQLARRAVRR